MNIFERPSTLSIILVRAGSTELDDQGRITGSLDMPLSDSGIKEATATASQLGDRNIDAIFSARCLAAQQTAKLLSNDGAIRVRVEESLSNLNHGLWHGKSLDELKETQPKLYRQWNENPDSVCPPDGETIETVRSRIKATLNKIRRKNRSGTIAIVAPEPLYSIIQSELESSELRNLFEDKREALGWDLLKVANAVV